MPTFPRTESELLLLAAEMIQGYTEYPASFPNADVAALTAARDAFVTDGNTYHNAHTAAKKALEAKDTSKDFLQGVMKRQLRQSEVDTKNNPVDLGYIGWAPKAPPTPQPVPGDPRSFVCTQQKGDTVRFDWKAPEAGSGGPVRSYIIERREYPVSGLPSEWHQAGVSTATEAILTGQPRGIQLEYQVLAINPAGAGNPSAIQAVVL